MESLYIISFDDFTNSKPICFINRLKCFFNNFPVFNVFDIYKLLAILKFKVLWRIDQYDNTINNKRNTIAQLICNIHAVSYTHLRAHETRHDLVCRLLLEKKKKKK